MYIEERIDSEYAYLVNEILDIKEGCSWCDCSQEGFKEYGSGNKMYLFEAMGAAYQPFALDLIHANSKTEAENMVQDKYACRFNYHTLIRKYDELTEVIDER